MRLDRRHSVVIMMILMMTNTLSSQAADYQEHASIYSVAKRFMQQHLATQQHQDATVTMSKLDRRLNLNRCDKTLEAFLPRGSRNMGNTTVGVRCTGNRPWSINIPAKVSVFRNVLVSTKLLSRGESIRPGDLKLASRNLADLPHGYLQDYDDSLGMNVKRRIMPDTAVTPAMLKKPQLIKRGQKVSIISDAGRAQVRMLGKALAGGAAGDRIQVQNASSSRKLEGVVTSDGAVRIH